MIRNNYVLDNFLQALRKNFKGFKDKKPEVQAYITQLFFNGITKKKAHKSLDDQISIPYQELRKELGRSWKTIITDLGIFEVTPNWSKKKHITRGIKLSDKANKLREQCLKSITKKKSQALTKVLDKRLRTIKTPLQAVASKDRDYKTLVTWNGIRLPNVIKINIEKLQEVEKLFEKEIKKREKGLSMPDMFIPNSTSPEKEKIKLTNAIDEIRKILHLAHTETGGEGHLFQRYTESTAGRLYADGTSLQNVTKEVKNVALLGQWEYDFENCHYSIFRQMAATYQINCKNIDYYLSNKKAVRNQLATELDIDIEKVKICLLAIMYGAKTSKWQESAIPKVITPEKAKKLYQHKLFLGISRDVEKGRKIILSKWPISKGKYKNMAGKCINKHEQDKKILAHLIQGIEAKMLRASIEPYSDNILLLQHDGFTANIKIDKATIIERIKEATGMEMKLSEQKLTISEKLVFSKL